MSTKINGTLFVTPAYHLTFTCLIAYKLKRDKLETNQEYRMDWLVAITVATKPTVKRRRRKVAHCLVPKKVRTENEVTEDQ